MQSLLSMRDFMVRASLGKSKYTYLLVSYPSACCESPHHRADTDPSLFLLHPSLLPPRIGHRRIRQRIPHPKVKNHSDIAAPSSRAARRGSRRSDSLARSGPRPLAAPASELLRYRTHNLCDRFRSPQVEARNTTELQFPNRKNTIRAHDQEYQRKSIE